MSESLDKKLVTADLLKSFGDKCKLLFSQTPIIGNCTQSIRIPSCNLTNRAFYIQVEGFNSDKKQVLFFIQFVSYDKKASGSCITVGEISPTIINFAEDGDDKSVWITIENVQCLVSVRLIQYQLEENSWKPVYSQGIAFVEDGQENNNPQNESWISDADDAIGTIKSVSATPFIIKGANSCDYTYPTITTFDSIWQAHQSSGFDKNKTITYGDSSEDTVTDFTGDVIKLPLPGKTKLQMDGQNLDTNGNYVMLCVRDGEIEGCQKSSINVATTSEIGGIKISDDSANQNGAVYLNDYGYAYVNVPSSIQADLTAVFAETKQGQIFQHIGSTTDDLVNGYFYKSTDNNSTYTYKTTQYNGFYTFASNVSNNLNQLVTDQKISLPNGFKCFKLWVNPTGVTKVGDLTSFLLTAHGTQESNTTSLELTLDELKQLGVSLDPDVAANGFTQSSETRVYNTITYSNPLTFNKDAVKYEWVQWDTQPSVIATNDEFYIISHQDIDNMMTPVESVSLSATELTVTQNTSKTLTATVTPNGANTAITWSVDNPAIVTISPITGPTITVSYVSDGEAVVTATTDFELKTASCTITSEYEETT